MEPARDIQSDETTSARRIWFWIGTFASLSILAFGLLASFVLEPYVRARMAVIQLQALGASVDYNESSLSRQFREAWHYFSNRNLAITASAIYCRKDRHRTIADYDLVHARAFPQLFWLDLRDQAITSEGLRHLEGLNLEALTLTRTKVGATPDGLAPLGTLKHLQVLKLDQTRVTDDDLKHLSTLHRLGGLDLSNTPVTSTGMGHLSSLINLASLNLSQTKVNNQLPPHLHTMKELQTLDLRGTAVTGAGLDVLRGSRLRELLLADTQLNDDGLRAIGHLPLLADLNIAQTHITPLGLKELKKLKHLRSLDLRGPSIRDDHLAALAGCHPLRSLKISDTQITAQGFQHLKSLTGLTRIEIDGRWLWNPDVIAVLQGLPKLTTVEFKLSGKMLFDFEEIQQQLGQKIRLFEISEAPPTK